MPLKPRTILQYERKLKLSQEVRDGSVHLTVYENERKIVHAAGKTEKEAAFWLMKHVNRLMRQTEDLILEIGFLTTEEIDTAVTEDDFRSVAPDDA